MTRFADSPVMWGLEKLSEKITGRPSRPRNSGGMFNINNSDNGGAGGGSGNAGLSGNQPNPANFMGIAALLALIVIYLFISLTSVNEKDRALVFLNGEYVETLDAGYYVLPWPLYTTKTIDVSTIQEIPVQNESLTIEEDLALTGFTLQYKVSDPYKYYRVTKSPSKTFEFYLESSGKAVIADMTLDDVLTDKRPLVKESIVTNINRELNTDSYGITIVDVLYELSKPPAAVKGDYEAAVKAREIAQSLVNDAENYRNGKLPDSVATAKEITDGAQAYAKQQIEKANGDVSGFMDLLPEYKAAPDITRKRMYYSAMGKILKGKKKVIYDLDSESSSQLNHLDVNELIKR